MDISQTTSLGGCCDIHLKCAHLPGQDYLTSIQANAIGTAVCLVLESRKTPKNMHLKKSWSATETETAPPPKYRFLRSFRASFRTSSAPKPVGYPKIL